MLDRNEACLGTLPGVPWIACGEGGGYCSDECMVIGAFNAGAAVAFGIVGMAEAIKRWHFVQCLTKIHDTYADTFAALAEYDEAAHRDAFAQDAFNAGAAVLGGILGMAEAIRATYLGIRPTRWTTRMADPIDLPFLCSPDAPCDVFYTCAKHREG